MGIQLVVHSKYMISIIDGHLGSKAKCPFPIKLYKW